MLKFSVNISSKDDGWMDGNIFFLLTLVIEILYRLEWEDVGTLGLQMNASAMKRCNEEVQYREVIPERNTIKRYHEEVP